MKLANESRVEIGVRELVAFSMRTGDLRSDGPLVAAYQGGSGPVDAIRRHQQIQGSRPEGYRAEVSVALEKPLGSMLFRVRGRIDGVFASSSEPILEEIKTTHRPLAYSPADSAGEAQHWAQLKIYAHMLLQESDYASAAGAKLQLTYAELASEKTREIERWFTRSSLEEAFDSALAIYAEWRIRLLNWHAVRNASLVKAPFPHGDFRPGQRALAASVYQSIVDGTELFVEAPTGTGKTAACLFPAVKVLAEDRPRASLFFLTARTTGRLPIENELKALAAAGTRLKSLTLSAKRSICFNPERACHPDECEYAKGYYDRIAPARRELFERDSFDAQSISDIAERYRVCPFELSLELAPWVDCLVCDYNYAFDPQTNLRRLFGETQHRIRRDQEKVLLIDEAHQLVDRGRAMFSARLEQAPWKQLTRRPGVDKELRRRAKAIASWMERRWANPNENRPSHQSGFEAEFPSTLLPVLRRFVASASKSIHQPQRLPSLSENAPSRLEIIDLAGQAVRFLRIAELFEEERFVTLFEPQAKSLSLFCADAAPNLKQALARFKARIFLSATLQPLDYAERSIGAQENARWTPAASTFPSSNLAVFVAHRINTRFRERERTKTTVAELLASFVKTDRGNYLLFFPSYRYLETVRAIFEPLAPKARILTQTPGMDEAARRDFLAAFDTSETATVGFATLGGVFAEGVDLPGKRLSGAAVVGVGLPAVGVEREAIRRRFDACGGRGFDFAYTYPGLQRVLQAAGRVIRSERDRGAVLLIGERFNSRPFSDLLPRSWDPERIVSAQELTEKLSSFWKMSGQTQRRVAAPSIAG